MAFAARTVKGKDDVMSAKNTPCSIGNGNLLDRLFHTLRRHSEAAESLLHTLCHSEPASEGRVYVVGGLVRDILLCDMPTFSSALDIDLAVDGDPSPIHHAVAAATSARLAIHDRFGTASAMLLDGTRIDVARTRSECYHSPGALPIVSPANIETDLSRRDFTVNAVALSLGGDRVGELLDPHGALRDLSRRSIRTLNRTSFRDDPTRLVRAARYAARIRGTIERRTFADARRDRGHLVSLSPERFGDAWRLLLSEEDPFAALEIARRLKIPQSREPRWSVPRPAIAVSDEPDQFWAAIGLLSRDLEIVDWLPRSVGMHRRERTALEAGSNLRKQRRRIGLMQRPSSVAETLGRFPVAALLAAEKLWTSASGSATADYLERRASIDSPISAHRLLDLGVEHGPLIGRWLRRIEAAVWDGELAAEDPESVARMEQRIRWSR